MLALLGGQCTILMLPARQRYDSQARLTRSMIDQAHAIALPRAITSSCCQSTRRRGAETTLNLGAPALLVPFSHCQNTGIAV